MEDRTDLNFKQLEVANSSTLLIYTRDRNDHSLARKLRPEFNKVLTSAEAKDCQRLISRVTNDNKEASHIDILLAEFDMSIPKLVDYVNKRPHHRETNMCPLIPIIIITKEGGEKDAAEDLHRAGGVNKIFSSPVNTQELFNIMLDLLYNRKRVEETFTNIKKHPLISAKFPYISIFDARPPLKISDVMNENESVRTAGLNLTMENTIEEIDDASESSSLLPSYVKDIRNTHPELRNKFVRQNTSESVKDKDQLSIVDSHHKSRPSQNSTLKKQLWKQPSNKRIDLSEVPSPRGKLVLPEEHVSSVDLLNSNDARAHSAMFRPLDSLDNSVTHTDNVDNQSTLDFDRGVEKTKTTGPQVKALLDPFFRPHWQEGSTDNLHDYSHFVAKKPPSLQRPSTVSGLDRRKMQRYWRGIKKPLTSSQLFDRGDDHERHGLPRISSMKSISTESQPKTPNKSSRRPSTTLDTTSRGSFDEAMTGNNGSGVIWLRKNSTDSDVFSLFSTSSDHQDTNKYYRRIAGVARSHTADLQVTTLLDIDFSSRLINLGEKEMLERGKNLQKADDLDAAVIYYTRAGAHSKDPQISRMLIGNVEYSRNKLLSALRYYGLAISIIESKPPALRPLQDAFIGYYNRAIIHFRLGDDGEGLNDLEQAVIIDPRHTDARELLSLVKRRLGRYNQAIEEAILSKSQKMDAQRKEKQQDNELEDASNGAIRGLVLEVPDESCSNSLREKKLEARLQIKLGEDSAGDNLGGGYLKVFKIQNHVKMELYDEIFLKPTELQEALISIPNKRTPKQLEIVGNLLSFFMPLQSLTPSTLQELAGAVEYRAISNVQMLSTNLLFHQNKDPYAVCLLVNGGIQSQLDYNASTQPSMSSIILDEYNKYEIFGHIDYLFHKVSKELVKVIEDALAPKQKEGKGKVKDDGESVSSHESNESEEEEDDEDKLKQETALSHEQVRQLAFKQLLNELNMLVNEPVTTDPSPTPPILPAPSTRLPRQSTAHTNANTLYSTSVSVSRALRPGMFATYSLQQPSELLLVNPADYHKYFFSPALRELKERLETLLASGLFVSWRPEEIIRIARMSRVERRKRGECILSQGQKPDHLYIIMKGICKVFKKPNRTAMLVHKLEVAREKANQHDLKYVYHHQTLEFNFNNIFAPLEAEQEEGDEGMSMSTEKKDSMSTSKEKTSNRNPSTPSKHQLSQSSVMSHSSSKSNSKVPNTPTRQNKYSSTRSPKKSKSPRYSPDKPTSPSRKATPALAPLLKKPPKGPKTTGGLKGIVAFPTALSLPPPSPTSPERERRELAEEIEKLEGMILQAKLCDAQDTPNGEGGSADLLGLPSTKPFARAAVSREEKEASEIGRALGAKEAEIATLQWPRLFGESCVLDPDGGISSGSIVADTGVELLVVHKKQIQTFQIDDLFLDKVKAKALVYPEDPDIVVSLYRKQEWGGYCNEVMKNISTVRWPKPLLAHEPFSV